jgi:antitoxin component YwqK of YwqJK toxin-antitoxin module
MVKIERCFKPGVSWIIAGYIFMSVIFLSCTQDSNQPQEIKIAKTIPTVFVNKDSALILHDTVFLKESLFSGYLYTLYPSGDTSFIGGYFNGVEEGSHKKWFENGTPEESRFYINGKKEGEQHGWWENGKPKFSFTAYNDEYNGEFKEWYHSGLIGKLFHYANGHEEGSQKLWWDNGTIRANYVIKKGRKFGLIGLKTCVNPYDSIIKK